MTRLISTAALVAGLVLALSTAAHAQAPVATDACYVPASGTVYVIGQVGSPTACAAGHTQVSLQGPPPVVGVAGYEIVTVEVIGAAGGYYAEADALCPVGKVAIGGGGWAVMGEATFHVRSQPVAPQDVSGWRFGIGWTLDPGVPPQDGLWGRGYAVCVIAQ